LAILIALSRTLQNTIYPVLLIFQSVPKVALAPVLVFSMGLNDWPKITVAFLVSFFPIIVDTATGLKAVDPELMDMIHSFSANPWQAFVKVRFPAAMPFIFSGLKVAISLAVVGAVIGEFVASDKGLGNLILIATANANNGLAFGAMLLLSLLGIVLFAVVALIERLVLWYR
jgi:NitT/TauT family transport system permease protein